MGTKVAGKKLRLQKWGFMFYARLIVFYQAAGIKRGIALLITFVQSSYGRSYYHRKEEPSPGPKH